MAIARPVRFRFKGDWEKYGRKLKSPLFATAFKKTGSDALEIASLHLVKRIRGLMKKGRLTSNASLTIAIKGSSAPLVDYGDLRAAVTYQLVHGQLKSFVGVLGTARNRDGTSLANIGEAVHEGVKIAITPKMRRMFFYLYLASTGELPAEELTGRAAVLFKRYKKWKPLRAEATHITIKGRPFISRAALDIRFRSVFRRIMERAVIRALKMVK